MNNNVLHSRSCTTMLAKDGATKNGDTIFAKNSDRPLNEAQPLCFYPAMDYPEGAEVQCSFIRIPQVRHTYSCIGSKPHVFFGFEHGINENGLIIGNEQVSGRELPERQWGLIGMDILRLALERSKDAAEAISIISDLLQKVGTGGDPSVRISAFNANYIIADPKEAYLFESHQRNWVAKKIANIGYLSNCYSIQEDYDLVSKNAVEEAVKKGWHFPGNAFNPAKAWTKDDCVFAESEGFVRYARLRQLMEERGSLSIEMMMGNLRDHYDNVFLSNIPYSPAAAKIPCICSHPGGVSGCSTAASTVTVLRKDVPKELIFTYWASMAPPCCSIFRPVYNINWLPEDFQKAHALYRPEDQWWVFTELERYIALNYEDFSKDVKISFAKLETEFIQEAEHIEKEYNGDISVLKEFSQRAAIISLKLVRNHIDKIKKRLKTRDIDRMLLSYFTESSKGCGMPYDENTII